MRVGATCCSDDNGMSDKVQGATMACSNEFREWSGITLASSHRVQVFISCGVACLGST